MIFLGVDLWKVGSVVHGLVGAEAHHSGMEDELD